jgi:hypothetical protein
VLMALVSSSFAGVEIKKKKGRTLYLLSIGLSYDGKRMSESNGIFDNCPTCINDAKGMEGYFSKLRKEKGGLDSVISYVYTKDISLDTLYKVFSSLQTQITQSDIFVFYYASIGWGIQPDGAGNSEGFYMLNQLAATANKENNVYTLRHLKQLTDRIAAQRQLIIFDTGDGRVISPDYYRNFFSDNLAEATFSKKNRVVICPEEYSFESKDSLTGEVKGDLYNVISNLPAKYNILTVFDTVHNGEDYKNFWRYWYENQLRIRSNISIIDETQYLKVLSSLDNKQGNSKRGLTIKQAEPKVDENILTKKKKALIVATNDYAARNTWRRLQNPVNDGRDAAKIFASLGYEVTFLYNKPKDTILTAISELVDNEVQNPYNQYIIYFAGHGFYDARQKAGFIVCADSKDLANIQKPGMTELNTYIDYTVLFRKLDQLNKVVLITDVCFGGTSVNSLLQWSREADPKGESEKMKNPFKKVLASGITEVDDFIRYHNGSISRNSPFAAALFEVLQKEGSSLSFEELFSKLKVKKDLVPTPIESSFGTEKIPNVFSF